VQTDNPNKAALYWFTIKIKLKDYPTNPGASKDFSVLIENKCENSLNIVIPTPPADVTYTVARTSAQTYFEAFKANLSSDSLFSWYARCPWTWSSSVSPLLLSPDDTAIVYAATARTHTVYTTNIAVAGIYTVTVRLVRPSLTPTAFSFSFKITIINPCLAATFSFTPSFVPSKYEYVVSHSANVKKIIDAVTSTETLATCPPLLISIK